jgi:uncharacterized protein YndB with AHSA1/START domain
MQKEINHKWFFQQSPNEVWDYLTKPELIEQWLMKNDFLPIIGHKFQFRHAPSSPISENEKIHYCEVLEIVPLQKLSYSWKVGKGDGERTIDSIVVWTLSEKNGGTELHLLHNGFTLLEDVIAHANGWNACLYQFTQLLYISNHANTNA